MADEEVEVLVIGSGAGGAPLANTLVKAGHQVLMLEKGPLLRTQQQAPDGLSDYKRDELFATGAEKRLTMPGMANIGEPFFSSHAEPDLNDEPHVYRNSDGRDYATIEGYTAQVVGGGTQLYGGVSLRFTPDDLRLQTLQRRPHGPAQRPERRGRARGTRLARLLRRARAVLLRGRARRRAVRDAREPGEAGVGRPLPAAA